MISDLQDSARYVTRLDNSWHGCDSVDFAVLQIEKMTSGLIGNKAFKLANSLAMANIPTRIMSFGGAWSNHLHALAYLCHLKGIGSVGIVRAGESTNNVLQRSMRRYGMQLHFVDRAEYRSRDDPDYCQSMSRLFECSIWLPEGGSDTQAVDGCADIGTAVRESGFQPDVVIVPVGTGATLAGVINGTDRSTQVAGLPVIRDHKVFANVSRWVHGNESRWAIHAPLKPGYGKSNESLLRFIIDVYTHTGMILDPVYTGKALMHCLRPEFLAIFPQAARLMFVHTGGVTGNYGFMNEYRALSGSDSADFIVALNRSCEAHVSPW